MKMKNTNTEGFLLVKLCRDNPLSTNVEKYSAVHHPEREGYLVLNLDMGSTLDIYFR